MNRTQLAARFVHSRSLSTTEIFGQTLT